MKGALAPILFVLLIGAVAGLLFLLRGDPEPRPPDGDRNPSAEPHLPAFVPQADRAAVAGLRLRLRDALGRDAEAFVELRTHTPADPDHRVEWLRFFRPEVDLAIRSGDSDAGDAALDMVGRTLGEPGSPARTLVDSTAYRDTWIRALESETPQLRMGALRLLSKLGGDSNRARVVPLLDDPVRDVRVTAVDTYAAMGGATSRLLARHAVEKDARVRLSILMAFGLGPNHRSPEVHRIEVEAMKSGSDSERLAAMDNLMKFRDQDALEAVLEILDSPTVPVRHAALQTLARLQDRRSLERLRSYADEEKFPALAAQARKVISTLE